MHHLVDHTGTDAKLLPQAASSGDLHSFPQVEETLCPLLVEISHSYAVHIDCEGDPEEITPVLESLLVTERCSSFRGVVI